MVTIAASVGSALVSGLAAIIVCRIQNDKLMALVMYRLEQLEKKVDAHNNLVERMTAVETQLKTS